MKVLAKFVSQKSMNIFCISDQHAQPALMRIWRDQLITIHLTTQYKSYRSVWVTNIELFKNSLQNKNANIANFVLAVSLEMR